MQAHETSETATPRRDDAGTFKITDRGITGLLLCAEQYGAPYDLLAAALDVTVDRLRGIVARWRHAGYAATGGHAGTAHLPDAEVHWPSRTRDYGTATSPSHQPRYGQIVYVTTPAATPTVTRAITGLPAPLQARMVTRDLPPGAIR